MAFSAATVARLRSTLESAGYTEDRIGALCGMNTFPAKGSTAFGRTLFRTRGDDAFSTLARLFLLGQPVEEERVRRVLAPATPEDLGCLRLTHSEGGWVCPHVTLVELNGLWVAFDPPPQLAGTEFPDVVNGPTVPSGTLDRFAVRRPARRTLDLGTGCGYLALLARRWSQDVCGTDVNARCLEFGAFNAALNGTEARWRCGDLFGAVGGERFDLILTNPPFIIAPFRRLVYRDGGMEGDGFARRIVAEAPPFLAEGGYLQMVFNWVHPAGEDWRARLESWFAGTDCDVWILRSSLNDPVQYAEEHIAATEGVRATESVFREWFDYYRERGYEAISTGYAVMRRRSPAANWLIFDELPQGMPENFGKWVERRFAARDLMHWGGDRAVLSAALRVAPEVLLVRAGSFGEGGIRIDRRELKPDRALPLAFGIDAGIEALLSQLDGRKPVLDVLRGTAEQAGADTDALARQILPFLREMLEQGALVAENQSEACDAF